MKKLLFFEHKIFKKCTKIKRSNIKANFKSSCKFFKLKFFKKKLPTASFFLSGSFYQKAFVAALLFKQGFCSEATKGFYS
jgi:hypothetical protein